MKTLCTKRIGFTLIEVMVVLTIIVIVSAIAIPLISGTVATQRLRRAGDVVRAEWNALRMQAITEGRIMVFRAAIGNDAILVESVLDPHLIATLSTESRYDTAGRMRRDTLTSEEFSMQDDGTLLKSANTTSDNLRTRNLTLPSGVFTADVVTLPDDRTAFVLGASLARGLDPENSLQYEEVAQDETRFGEGAGSDGKLWSAPVLFFPDGSSSTAAVLLKGDSGRCLEVRLRGINGATTICPMTSADEYVGEMNATMTRSL
ncbi:MAG: pilus assembly FimT family protein [Thermoguttaceae bacterium]